MAEVSAQDLRRLTTLEERLEKAQGEKRSFTAERRELRARATAAERAARSAERAVSDTDNRLTALLEENARLATQLEERAADGEQLRSAAEKLREELDASAKSLDEVRSETSRLTESLAKAESERDQVTERLKLADAQLKTEAKTPILPAKDVARLIDGFVGELGTNLSGMAVREGEIKLQVAFGKVGTSTGFVVPSADSPPEVRKDLHEVSIRFDRAIEPRELRR
jgi:predicted RNase H-like nuclease (RuvC/YqgF family)